MSTHIPIKTAGEIDAVRHSCRAVSEIISKLSAFVAPGVTTGEVDELAAELMAERGGRSAFLNYRGFPGNICISLNEEVVHGIGGKRKIEYGDLVKLDVGIVLDGWVGDTAQSVAVGVVSPELEKLMAKTQEALVAGIFEAKEGARVGDIGAAVEEVVTKAGYSVVREFVGHGVGRKLHEEPQIPNFGKRNTGARLKAGMVLAIEPMVNLGRADVRVLKDGWTVVTVDGKHSSHFEHTILVTEGEPEILTQRVSLPASMMAEKRG
jgi:methionyl aminopeptidase